MDMMRCARIFGLAMAGFGSIGLATALAAAEVSLEVVSKARTPRPTSGGDAGALELSADGRWAAFVSSGNGLATNDNNGMTLDVFLRDLQTGGTTLISRAPNGESGNGHSFFALISADGRFVVFESEADNLVEEDENDGADIFLYDRTDGSIKMLTQGEAGGLNGEASLLAISQDARFVFFESDSDDYVEADNNGGADFFLLDRETGEVELISRNFQGSGTARFRRGNEAVLGNADIAMSGNAERVAFVTAATNIVLNVSSNLLLEPQLYLWDRATGENRLITPTTNNTSRTGSSAVALNQGGDWLAFISGEGLTQRLYVHHIPSQALEQVILPGVGERAFQQLGFDAAGKTLVFSSDGQVWLRDMEARSNQLVSATSSGMPAGQYSDTPVISVDGQTIVYTSSATNLPGNFGNGFSQLYSFRRATGQTKLLSQSAGVPADFDVHFPVLSADGTTAGFMTYARNLGGNAGYNDVFAVHTSGNAAPVLVSAGHSESIAETGDGPSWLANSALSLDGRYVVFSSNAEDLVAEDTNQFVDIFLRDLWKGETKMISHTFSKKPRIGPALNGMSRNGRTVVMSGHVTVDGAEVWRILTYDVPSGTLRLGNVSPEGAEMQASARSVTISDDGRYLAFLGTTNSGVFVRDLLMEKTTRYNHAIASGDSVRISPRGRYILVHRNYSNIAVALIDLETGNYQALASQSSFGVPFSADDSTLLLSRFSTSPGGSYSYVLRPATASSNVISSNRVEFGSINADGSVALLSWRSSASAGEAMLVDLRANTTNSLRFNGSPVLLRGISDLTPDGRYLAVVITNEVTESRHQFSDVYVYDRILTNFTLVSRSPISGTEGEGPSSNPSISADGRVVVFDSSASDLTRNDRNSVSDVFVARLGMSDSNQNGLEDGWEFIHFSGLGMADAAADLDSDGATNLQEFLAGTNPRDVVSALRLQTASETEPGTFAVVLPETAIGKSYQLQHRASLTAGEWRDVGRPQTALSTTGLVFGDNTGAASGFFRLKIVSE
jgi:Tol biopolymer transport system component